MTHSASVAAKSQREQYLYWHTTDEYSGLFDKCTILCWSRVRSNVCFVHTLHNLYGWCTHSFCELLSALVWQHKWVCQFFEICDIRYCVYILHCRSRILTEKHLVNFCHKCPFANHRKAIVVRNNIDVQYDVYPLHSDDGLLAVVC